MIKRLLYMMLSICATVLLVIGCNDVLIDRYSKQIDKSITSARNDEEWMRIIQEKAKSIYVAPVNAKIDHVWKAIPGYNGIELKVEETYQQAMKHRDKHSISWITREVEPTIQLADFGPYPIYKGNPNKPMVSIMINVAWGNEYIPSMLSTLKKHDVKATFFFDGSWLSKHLEIARLISQDGHELSNHAYSHRNMSKLSRNETYKEIAKTQHLLKEKLNVDNSLFAPPSGDFNQETVEVAAQLQLRTVLWTLDTVDWRNPSMQAIMNRISSRIEPGSLILMHPTSAAAQALPHIIDVIQQKDLYIGTVSETISSKRVPHKK
jgi:probable sporulation protein (polysaccharide deacetylase family)